MDNENEEDQPRVQADKNSIAVGGISIGGDISGNITIGHTGYTVEQVSILLTQITSTFQPKPFDGRCPYKGLEVFEEEDAKLFFGREKLVEDLINRVKESRTVFITGPSGSGKSSLVRAGLIHALKQGAIKNLHSERWLYETMKPGREPIKDLALAFSRLKSPDLADYFQEHASERDILNKCAESVLSGRKDQRFVLFIDQFEEVFTQINQEEERLAFLNMLAHAGTVENGRVIILFAMRSDFVSNCATYPALNEMLSQQFRQIGAMQPEELVSAIALPAKHVGLPIQDELIARIINDMKGEPGALPLMQFALKDLFDSQQEKGGVIALTLEDYLRHGGIHKSLERHANASFAKLSENEQELARSIFSGLIEIGRGTQDTRRTALFEELVPANAKATEVESVVQRLADARLIITDEQAGKDTVTISHEKLIDAWPWLKKLVNENRDVIALQHEIANDAKEWNEKKRDASYLYSGARLINAGEQLEANKLVLSGLAQEYVQAGIARQKRGQYILVGGLSTFVVLLIVAVIVFAGLTNEAREQANIAQAASTRAVAQEATAQANANAALTAQAKAEELAFVARGQALAAYSQLTSENLQLKLLLAVEAIDAVANLSHAKRLLPEQALQDSLSQISGIPLPRQEDLIQAITFSPDGRLLATGGKDKIVRLWDMQDTSTGPTVLSGHEGTVTNLAFSSNGHLLATRSDDDTIRLWDLEKTSAEPVVLSGKDSLAFSPDGNWLASWSTNGESALFWDLQDLSLEAIIGETWNVVALAFSPDGQWLAIAYKDKTVRIWGMQNLSAEPIVLSGDTSPTPFLVFSPNSRWLAFSVINPSALVPSVGNRILLWDAQNPSAEPRALYGAASIVAFSSDSRWIAAALAHNISTLTASNRIYLWDLENPSPEPQSVWSNHESVVNTLAFSSDGYWLATGSDDRTVRLWSYPYRSEPTVLQGFDNPVNSLVFSEDGTILVAAGEEKIVRLWNMQNVATYPITLGELAYPITELVLSFDDRWMATRNSNGAIYVQDTNNPLATPKTFKENEDTTTALALSPDGRLLATATKNGTIRVQDTTTSSSKIIFLREEYDEIESMFFTLDGRWLATQSTQKEVRLWNVLDSSVHPILLRGAEGWNTFLPFPFGLSPDGRWLFTRGNSNIGNSLWDLQNLSAEPITLADSYSHSWIFSPDGRFLAIGSSDNTIRLLGLRKTPVEPVILQEGHGEFLAFSPDGTWLATWSTDGSSSAKLWDLRDLSGKPRIWEDVINVAFSPDGQWLLIHEEQSMAISLWDLQNPLAEPIFLQGSHNNISFDAFSPDGNWLLTSSDEQILLWDMQNLYTNPITLKEVATSDMRYLPIIPLLPAGQKAKARFLTFSPSGQWLVTEGLGASVHFWSLNIEEQRAMACNMVGRNFTYTEWMLYFPNEPYRKTCEQWPLEPEVTATATP